jgi:phosphate transport system permease protein
MRLGTRKLLDRSFSGMGLFSVLVMSATLVIVLGPVVVQGSRAFVFRATVEHRRFLLEKFDRGDRARVQAELAAARRARQPVYAFLAAYEQELESADSATRLKGRRALAEVKDCIRALLGPLPGDPLPQLPRNQYGQTRWDRALVKLHEVLYATEYDYSDRSRMGKKVLVPRVDAFRGTALEPLFAYLGGNLPAMLLPRLTVYWGFLLDEPYDANFFGGIWPAVLGTLYLTVGAMLVAAPMGIIAAIYLVEYAPQNRFVTVLRTCISTLAGVPSIVFGLFGLAFFINTLGVPKSVLAGSLTLALLVLPTVIRASEEAIRAVPQTYKEAAMSLGAGKGRTVLTVILPAAMSGILTSIIISMGRAAGETAPIMLTAATSLGPALRFWQTLSQPTPALPWNIFNLCTEHQAVDEIRHVQYGMVLTLVVLVLLLNLAAIVLRARISKKLHT